jgi:hypothetical protein
MVQIAPVAPTTRILLFPIVFCLVGWEDQDQKSEDTLETVSSSKGRQAQYNIQAKLHLEKSSQGEMLLAFKLLVYTHIDATSPNFGDRMTEHDHQPTS